MPEKEFVEKVHKLKGFIFDWDGVFNDGVKHDNSGSPFSEVDSMGLNMLRFSFYLKFGFIPHVFVITGENNKPAAHLGQREHFDAVYLGAKLKTDALHSILHQTGLAASEFAFVYDDILDLGVAGATGLRFFLPGEANILLKKYITEKKLSDYDTANPGRANAVREITELTMGVLGNFTEVVENRIEYSQVYKEYLEQRNATKTRYLKLIDGEFEEFPFI